MIFFSKIILRPVIKDKLNTDYNFSIISGTDKIGDGVRDIDQVSDQTSKHNIQNQTMWNRAATLFF